MLNILSLYNAFVNECQEERYCQYIVMEYMDGGSLDNLVKKGGCQDEVVLADISRQALTGLAFLHANHSVHRDIKPANILCSSSRVVIIANFRRHCHLHEPVSQYQYLMCYFMMINFFSVLCLLLLLLCDFL